MNDNSFDFPCSYTFRRYESFINEGILLPLLEPEYSEPPELPSQPEWSHRQWDYVQQLKGQMLHLENKYQESLKRRKRGPY